MDVRALKASIDKVELAKIRKRLRKRETKRLVRGALAWTGGFVLFTGAVAGVAAAGVSAVRRELKKRA
jgi:hypothetical protein